jgi:RHS repeat-associated protein
MDATVAPKLSGAELFTVLRSRLSPKQIRYRVALPMGSVLQAVSGGAVVSRDGSVSARVPAPIARDAQGRLVPVQMQVVGDELLLSIKHLGPDTAYPVLVDPEVVNITSSNTGWKFYKEPASRFCGEESTIHGIAPSEGAISVVEPETSYPLHLSEHCGEPEDGYIHAIGLWRWKGIAPGGPVEFYGVSFSGSSTAGPEYVHWHLTGCGEITSGIREGYLNEAPPSVVSFDGGGSCSTNNEAELLVEAGELRKREAVTVKATLSAEAVLTSSATAITEPSEEYGPSNEGEPNRHKCLVGGPVDCGTGYQTVSQTDLTVGGRGPGLSLTRTYNSRQAVAEGERKEHGTFGYGWTGSYSAHIVFGTVCRGEMCTPVETAQVSQNNGSTVLFEYSHEAWVPVGPLVQATLIKEGSSYIYTLPDQSKLEFNGSGQLIKELDRNGNAITLTYNAGKHLESATDGAGRKLTFAYNSEGLVESVKDPLGHTAKYTYEAANLASVTQPAETALRWQFKYNSEHELTSETDGRGHVFTTEYDSSHRVTSQTDPLKRTRKWEYAGIFGSEDTVTTVTEPNEAQTRDEFNMQGLPISVTHAFGSEHAATTKYEYDINWNLVAVTDPDGHKTEYGYDSAGNKTSEKNADSDETKWKYDGAHDIETETTPGGETATIKRNSKGDPEVIERPAPGSTTQKTAYKYASNGDIEGMTSPLERTWKYEYDSYGDRKTETDPEGDKRTWEYNEDSQETATVSPRGNAAGAEASKFTTKTELNAKGQPLKITDPLSHTTKYTYDGDGNAETVIDGNSHKTKYTYDADNELTKTEEPNKTVTETEYDSMGQVKSQTDGNKHVTKYVRNALEEVEEIVNPLGKKTLKEYDAAGNLVKLIDPKGRTMTYTYDPANRLTEIVYSSGSPSTVKYEYNKDGDRTKMTDGTGTTTYTPDQLDRTIESENGHKEVIKYEYNLGNQQTKITYPNTKAVERVYDKDGRLEKVADWNKNETTFKYNADSQLEKTVFPSATKDEDTYAYNDADQMSEVKMKKSTETLASLVYTRDSDGQVKKTTSKGLPGAEVTENTYDENSRLTKYGSTEYKYDSANNPTKEGSSTNTYNEGDEVEKGTGETYAYDELGERTKTTPEKGPATTYSYDQAGNLISAERSKEGETSEIKDTYAYNGEDLRTSQTISGTTSYLAWNMSEAPPLLLSDGTNSYIYGPGGLPVEQINNSTGTVLYLHHDQQGSTRLLTGSTGKSEATMTYDAYGNTTGTTGTATTPLGYDAQYTSADTKLIYLRARTYDPATAQFLSVDPLSNITRSLYGYAHDNPLNGADPTGLMAMSGNNSTGLGGSCETPTEHLERLERLRRLKEQVAREDAEEREKLHEEEKAAAEGLLGKTLKVIGGCLAGSPVGAAIGGEVGFEVGLVPGAGVGAAIGAPVGCAVGGLTTALSPVNPLQPSEGGP